MALTDIRKFNFYQKYLWSPTDFQNFQLWTLAIIEGLFEGMTGSAVLKGLELSAGGGLLVSIAEGIAVNENGRIVVLSPSDTRTLVAPSVNPRRDLFVLRPKLTNQTSIPEPINPSNNVFLHQKLDFDLLVLTGAESASPVYAAKQSGDIVIGGVYIEPLTVTLTQANFDLGVVDRPRKRRSKVKVVQGSYTMSAVDEIIEMDCDTASGLVVLPSAKDAEGQRFTVIRTDDSSNDCVVSGGEPINGLTSVDLDGQYQKLNLYSNGIVWRSI